MRRVACVATLLTLLACRHIEQASADPNPSSSVPTPASVMPRISTGRPSYANAAISPASGAFDESYKTLWQSGHKPTESDPDWLAVDISGVPVAQRTTVYSVWFNEAGYVYDTSGGYSYGLAGDYQIQSNTAPGGSSAPKDGWSTIVTRKGNTLSSGADLLHLSGVNWLRFVCTAGAKNTAPLNEYTQLQWDLHDAHMKNDGWKFIGDSITANSMGHRGTNDAFNQLVHKRVANFPAFEMGGHGFWQTAIALSNIDAYLANFPGTYVAFPLGTNDPDPDAYRTNMKALIDKVLAQGKIPVVPTIPYTGDVQHVSLVAKHNAIVHELYATYGKRLVEGPDLFKVLSDGRASMFDNPTDLHPNERGNAAIRQAWADAMVDKVYR